MFRFPRHCGTFGGEGGLYFLEARHGEIAGVIRLAPPMAVTISQNMVSEIIVLELGRRKAPGNFVLSSEGNLTSPIAQGFRVCPQLRLKHTPPTHSPGPPTHPPPGGGVVPATFSKFFVCKRCTLRLGLVNFAKGQQRKWIIAMFLLFFSRNGLNEFREQLWLPVRGLESWKMNTPVFRGRGQMLGC